MKNDERPRLHPDDLAELGRQVVDGLGGAVVSAEIPAWAGDYFRASGGFHWTHYMAVPGDPAGGVYVKVRALSSGCLELELERQDGSNRPFWRGMLRPVDAG